MTQLAYCNFSVVGHDFFFFFHGNVMSDSLIMHDSKRFIVEYKINTYIIRFNQGPGEVQ